MLVLARTIALCVIAPWLVTLVFIMGHKGVLGLPFALGVGLIGILITRIRWSYKVMLSVIYLPIAFFILVPYSISIVCDYNDCERLPDGRSAP